jgi:hypothetical protein
MLRILRGGVQGALNIFAGANVIAAILLYAQVGGPGAGRRRRISISVATAGQHHCGQQQPCPANVQRGAHRNSRHTFRLRDLRRSL